MEHVMVASALPAEYPLLEVALMHLVLIEQDLNALVFPMIYGNCGGWVAYSMIVQDIFVFLVRTLACTLKPAATDWLRPALATFVRLRRNPQSILIPVLDNSCHAPRQTFLASCWAYTSRW